jgi:hypothetical protein
MPSTSGRQRRFMAMCSTDEGRAKAAGKCPPRNVALEFRHADKNKIHAKAQRRALEGM